MANTYYLIASNTIGSGGASSVTFTSIAQTYTDLKLVISSRSVAADTSDGLYLKINTSASSFLQSRVYGSGTAVTSNQTPTNIVTLDDAANNTANVFGSADIYLPYYTASTNKAYYAYSVEEQNGTASYIQLLSGLWNGTAAITEINLYYGSTSNIAQYSSFSLYGIKNS